MNHPHKTASSVYIHIPFCATKCYYCAFNTYAFHKEQAKVYLTALRTEMELYAPETDPLQTIFIGGGTPSILSADSLTQLFADIHQHFQITPNAEITVECNPGTVDDEKLRVMRDNGVNRLSFGLQAMQDDTLKQLGRIHTVDEFLQSYRLAREGGFENINIDLIFALPDQKMEAWHTPSTKSSPLNLPIFLPTTSSWRRRPRFMNGGKPVNSTSPPRTPKRICSNTQLRHSRRTGTCTTKSVISPDRTALRDTTSSTGTTNRVSDWVLVRLDMLTVSVTATFAVSHLTLTNSPNGTNRSPTLNA